MPPAALYYLIDDSRSVILLPLLLPSYLAARLVCTSKAPAMDSIAIYSEKANEKQES
jgi:hypothetical protein